MGKVLSAGAAGRMYRPSSTTWILFLLLSACGGSDGPSTPALPSDPSTPLDLTTYGSEQGLTGRVIDASPDDNQNIWAATPDALYVLQPGQTTFKRFTAA